MIFRWTLRFIFKSSLPAHTYAKYLSLTSIDQYCSLFHLPNLSNQPFLASDWIVRKHENWYQKSCMKKVKLRPSSKHEADVSSVSLLLKRVQIHAVKATESISVDLSSIASLSAPVAPIIKSSNCQNFGGKYWLDAI